MMPPLRRSCLLVLHDLIRYSGPRVPGLPVARNEEHANGFRDDPEAREELEEVGPDRCGRVAPADI